MVLKCREAHIKFRSCARRQAAYRGDLNSKRYIRHFNVYQSNNGRSTSIASVLSLCGRDIHPCSAHGISYLCVCILCSCVPRKTYFPNARQFVAETFLIAFNTTFDPKVLQSTILRCPRQRRWWQCRGWERERWRGHREGFGLERGGW